MSEISKITLKQIIARLRNEFELWDSDGYSKLPDDLAIHFVNEAQLQVARDCKCATVLNTTDTVTSGARAYDLTTNISDFLELIEFRIGANTSTDFRGHPLKIVDSKELDYITSWRR